MTQVEKLVQTVKQSLTELRVPTTTCPQRRAILNLSPNNTVWPGCLTADSADICEEDKNKKGDAVLERHECDAPTTNVNTCERRRMTTMQDAYEESHFVTHWTRALTLGHFQTDIHWHVFIVMPFSHSRMDVWHHTLPVGAHWQTSNDAYNAVYVLIRIRDLHNHTYIRDQLV